MFVAVYSVKSRKEATEGRKKEERTSNAATKRSRELGNRVNPSIVKSTGDGKNLDETDLRVTRFISNTDQFEYIDIDKMLRKKFILGYNQLYLIIV